MMIVQVGANKGATDNDPVWRFCQENLPESLDWELLLFEPNPKAAKICRENYKKAGFKDTTVLEFAVSNEEKEIILYVDNDIPGNEGSQHASLYKSHMYKMGHIDTALSEIKVKSVLLGDFIPYEVYYLQIDTEGHDAKIIMSIDLSVFNIKHIEFEYCHLSQNEIELVLNYLESNGYKQIAKSHEDITFRKCN